MKKLFVFDRHSTICAVGHSHRWRGPFKKQRIERWWKKHDPCAKELGPEQTVQIG